MYSESFSTNWKEKKLFRVTRRDLEKVSGSLKD